MSTEYKTLSKIFNSNTLNELARGNLTYIQKVAKKFYSDRESISLKELYEESFKLLSKNYPNEYVYKNFIANKILIGRHSLNTATMLSEFRVGNNKADCVILNGKSVCYEIKTEYDSLARLDDQLNSYCQLFDEVNVVCSYKHLSSIIQQIHPDVGILLLSEKLTLQEVRKANKRTNTLNKKLMMQSLRKEEYLAIYKKISGENLIAPNTEIFDKCFDKISQYQDMEKLNNYFIEILKKYRKNDSDFIQKMPLSLTNAVISYKFNKLQMNTLINNFSNEGIADVLSYIEGKA
ncbi:sce7726 family protein [Acinetobacter pittii]|uniref:sce7726 family protein n=1 Tax=Acinetobacter pittii TaxID=48296 RepID=UPI00197F4352|nr:sce7726 family protein [Acinetobacter pittii]MBN6527856.1 sce7726 family protein [Acinetobacter pittii]